jgi:hypothetical protein
MRSLSDVTEIWWDAGGDFLLPGHRLIFTSTEERLVVSLFISLLCLYDAFRSVDLKKDSSKRVHELEESSKRGLRCLLRGMESESSSGCQKGSIFREGSKGTAFFEKGYKYKSNPIQLPHFSLSHEDARVVLFGRADSTIAKFKSVFHWVFKTF